MKTICYNAELRLEAYHFENITQPFPNHFHEHYSIGLVQAGKRTLICCGNKINISTGDILLFNPGESHSCLQRENTLLDFIGFNLSKELMLDLSTDITGIRQNLYFCQNVVRDPAIADLIVTFHKMLMEQSNGFECEESFLLMASTLIEGYCLSYQKHCQFSQEIQKACDFMQEHYSEHMSLERLCTHTSLSKSTLLRGFTKTMGVTPYRYLQALRINEAKKLLTSGLSPIEAAMATGFSDQSHFSLFFNMYTGLTPGAYSAVFKNRTI